MYAERTLYRRVARRRRAVGGRTRASTTTRHQLAPASARSPLHAEPGRGRERRRGRDVDVVVGDIVDVHPQAVGADFIPDMDGGTITVVDAVLARTQGRQ